MYNKNITSVLLLTLYYFVAFTSATTATCPRLESNAKIELERPKMEQYEWGVNGQKIKVR